MGISLTLRDSYALLRNNLVVATNVWVRRALMQVSSKSVAKQTYRAHTVSALLCYEELMES